MPSLTINGAKLVYEETGSGTPVVLTPGGRQDMEAVRGLAKRLSAHHRTIIYDRRNCGASDVTLEGELSEQEIWADDLYELLKTLDAVPAYVGGGSAGCRVSLLLAIRHPEAVKGLLLWNVSGGAVAAEQLGYTYYERFMDIALKDGMQGVADSDFFAERIKDNPSNQDRLLAIPTREFISLMQRWRAFFTADKPVIGATEAELKAIEVPVAIIPGSDAIHPTEVAENLHRILPHSKLYPPLWSPEEREALRDKDPVAFREQGHERAAAVYLPFLAELEEAKVSVP